PRRSSAPARKHDRWEHDDYGATDVPYKHFDDTGRSWADDASDWGEARQLDRWNESDADWRPNRRSDRGGRRAEHGPERWRETTTRWMVTQRKRILGTRRARIVAAIMLSVTLLCVLGPSIAVFAQYNQAKSGLAHFKNAQADLTYIAAH